MLKNYLKIAFRNLYRYKIISVINISGLAAGIACFILMFFYFLNEVSYDSFHKDANEIYRIYSEEKTPQGIEKVALTPDPLAETLRNDYPGFKTVSISNETEFPVSINGKVFNEKISEADPEFFSFFTFPFVEGDPETALNEPTSVVITKNLGEKYFGKNNPLGETILILNKYPVKVTGVLDKIPSNSSIVPNLVLSRGFKKHYLSEYNEQWTSSGMYTFIKCSGNYNKEMLQNILSETAHKYLPEFLKKSYQWKFKIQPLTSIHLEPEIKGANVPPVSVNYLTSLLIIALSIILIAIINFMNITAGRSYDRIKEINIRKIMGSKKSQLILQFLSESLVLSYIALLAGIILAEIFLPEFNKITGMTLEIPRFNFLNAAGLILTGLLVGILPGVYPAVLLTSKISSASIKTHKVPHGKLNIFRKILIVTQFAIATILITCLITVGRQIEFMKHYDIGFNKENVIVIPLNDGSGNSRSGAEKFADLIELQKDHGIISAAVSENTPGYYFNNEFGVIPEGFDQSQSITMVVTSADNNFLKTYEIPLIEGRNFKTESAGDVAEGVLINEKAMKKIGWKSAAGKTITFAHGEGPYKILGVAKNFNFKSLGKRIEPLIIRYTQYSYRKNYLSVRVNSSSIPSTINYLKDEWKKVNPGAQFSYFFVDSMYDLAYKAEENTAEIIGIFSVLAIVLASMGLLGLTILIIAQKTKEIGIRKVLGASVSEIYLLMSKQFIQIILVADIFAVPASYLLLNEWLSNYPYKISIGFPVFIIGGLIVLTVALITVSFGVMKSATTNPAESLRYE